MKVEVKEFAGCFSVDITAENMSDAALLVRLGMNRTDHIQLDTHASAEGGFTTSLIAGKSKRANSNIPKRK